MAKMIKINFSSKDKVIKFNDIPFNDYIFIHGIISIIITFAEMSY